MITPYIALVITWKMENSKQNSKGRLSNSHKMVYKNCMVLNSEKYYFICVGKK